jgi:hypothetical protein
MQGQDEGSLTALQGLRDELDQLKEFMDRDIEQFMAGNSGG